MAEARSSSGVFVQKKREKPGEKIRLRTSRHRLQLVENREGRQNEYLKRSVLGLVSVYNILPSRVVEANAKSDSKVSSVVSSFQSRLQDFVKETALAGDVTWPDWLSARGELPRHRHLQEHVPEQGVANMTEKDLHFSPPQ